MSLGLVPLVLLGSAHAGDLYVCAVPGSCSQDANCNAAPTDCFDTISSAVIDAADNDVIYLSDETYSETVVNDGGATGLTVIGEGVGLTFIEGASGAEGVKFKDVDASFFGLTFTHPGGTINRHGAKLESGTFLLSDVEFIDCQANHGGGLDVANGTTVMVENAMFLNNRSGNSGEGGGHINMHGGTVTVSNSVFELSLIHI